MRVLGLAILLMIELGACGGPDAPHTTLIVLPGHGDGQVDTVGQTLDEDLVVLVAIKLTPQPGQQVIWHARDGSVDARVDTTDVAGIATAKWTLGTQAGSQQVDVEVTGGQSAAVFHATALAGPAAQMKILDGNSQSASAGTVLPDPLQVQVTDAYGNPTELTGVSWLLLQGSATFPTPIFTGPSGIAKTTVTLGSTAGTVKIRAYVLGTSITPRVFTETALP